MPGNPSEDAQQRYEIQRQARAAHLNDPPDEEPDRPLREQIYAGFAGFLKRRGLRETTIRSYEKVAKSYFAWRERHHFSDEEWPPKGLHLLDFVAPSPKFKEKAMHPS